MGVYIKGMKMPCSCAECRLLGTCAVVGRWITPSRAIRLSEERHTKCPLVEVKEPHGDLIDRDDVLRISTAVDAYDYISSQEVYDIKAVIEGSK